MTVQAGLCWTWSEIQIVGFLTHRLIDVLSLIEVRTAVTKFPLFISILINK